MRLAEAKDEKVADGALRALAALGDAAAEAVPLLLRLVEKLQRREAVLSCLGWVGGKDAGKVIPVLRKYADQRQEVPTCLAALEAVAKFGAKKEVVDALIEGLKDVRADRRYSDHPKPVRRAALWWLRYLGPRAKAAAPRLLVIAKDKKEVEAIRQEALDALGEIRDRETVPDLLALVKDSKDSDDVRRRALMTLGSMGGKALVAPLVDVARAYLTVSDRAWWTLARIPEAVPALLAIAKDKKAAEEHRLSALAALGATGVKTAVPGVLAIAKDKSESARVREYAWRSLVHLDKAAAAEADRAIREE
jgi:HEAT repeat protein